MGQWTADYHDDVLVSKIKGLLAGSIKRAILEKSEPLISYEAFVEELDTGDSFTASLLDVLVKEMAERRTRPTTGDRRLIADRTAKSLRQLANPLRVYRERFTVRNTFGTRRAVNLSEYLSTPQDEMDIEEEDDEFETLMENPSAAEGARLNPDLRDTYAPSWSSVVGGRHPNTTQSAPSSSDATAETFIDTTFANPSARMPQWTFTPSVVPVPPPLQRQPSIRRAARSRTVDFTDFTSRRRSTIRQNAVQEGDGLRLEAVSDDAGPTLVLPSDDELSVPRPLNESSSTTRSLPTRRTLTTRRAHREVAGAWRTEGNQTPSFEHHWLFEEPTASGSWFSFPTPVSSASSQDPDSSEERTLSSASAPRLRRGGVRAPEAMLSRQLSPLASPHVEVPDVYRLPPSPRSPPHINDNTSHRDESAAPAEATVPNEEPTTNDRTAVVDAPTSTSVS